jgi:hypothetical protein
MTFDRRHVILSALMTLGVACGGSGAASSGGSSGGSGGGGGGGGPLGLVGVALPGEISALPTSATPAAPTPSMRPASLSLAPVAALPADSDYRKATTSKFVSEQSLEQFEVLNTIFDALAQTHYDDAVNLNQGPYSAIVSWVEKNKDQQEKRLVKWTVDSTRESETAPNVVKAWFDMPMKGDQLHTIQAKVVITSAPTRNADGSYSDYGVWTMQVKLMDGMPFRFVASAERDAQQRAVVKLGQSEPTGPTTPPQRTRGILVKSASSGSGKVDAPDYQNCMSPPCPQQQVAYVYDASDVTLQKGTATPVTKSRTSFVDIVNRYGLYDATTGADVSTTRSFGFPIRATVAGVENFGYYGAWQGRHQLWANGSSLPAGVTVTRADVPPNQAAPSYTTSPAFTGILVKRSYAPAQLSDLTGLVVETWDSRNFQLGFDGASWCTNPTMDFSAGQPRATCGAQSAAFGDAELAGLELNPDDKRRNVMINAPPSQPWNGIGTPPQPEFFVYLTSGAGGAGFYPAETGMGLPTPVPAGARKVFVAGDFVWVNVGGPIYISYEGLRWVQKQLLSFDQQTWTPTFKGPEFDQTYALQTGREYYFNNSGTNYVVSVSAMTLATSVQLEIQSVAHPWDAATFAPAGTVFQQPYCGQGTCSSFAFGTDPADLARFMKLSYATLSDKDAGSGKSVGDLVQAGMWGLQAVIGGQPVPFNWDYPPPGQQGGVQQFLMSGDAYVQLDDPIRLEAVTLSNAGGSRSFTLQFDGNWMQGLPNVWDELRRSGFVVSDAIRQKVFSIPSGELIGSFIAKQLQVSQYMAPSSGAPLDLAEALAIDLASVPAWVDNGMGAVPSPAPLRYSEGAAVATP